MRKFILVFFFFGILINVNAAPIETKSVDDTDSITKRSDGNFDVKCSDGRTEVHTKKEIQDDAVCLPLPGKKKNPYLPKDSSACSVMESAEPGTHVQTRISCPLKLKAVAQSPTPVDFLFVIDNSASMQDYQILVTKSSKAFFQELSEAGVIDWKLGLISTDDSIHPFLGFESEFNSSTEEPAKTFNEAVGRLGTYGSGTEKTYNPVKVALRTYADYLRPGSHLRLVIVTDEPEQSSLTTSEFISELENIRGTTPLNASVAGIFAANDLGCTPNYTGVDWEVAKDHYGELLKTLNGSQHKLCETDLTATMKQIASDTAKLGGKAAPNAIALEYKANPDSIEIRYEGAKIESEGTDGPIWEFNATTQTLTILDPSFLKNEDGHELEILFKELP